MLIQQVKSCATLAMSQAVCQQSSTEPWIVLTEFVLPRWKKAKFVALLVYYYSVAGAVINSYADREYYVHWDIWNHLQPKKKTGVHHCLLSVWNPIQLSKKNSISSKQNKTEGVASPSEFWFRLQKHAVSTFLWRSHSGSSVAICDLQ
jgi:hypothetical protein